MAAKSPGEGKNSAKTSAVPLNAKDEHLQIFTIFKREKTDQDAESVTTISTNASLEDLDAEVSITDHLPGVITSPNHQYQLPHSKNISETSPTLFKSDLRNVEEDEQGAVLQRVIKIDDGETILDAKEEDIEDSNWCADGGETASEIDPIVMPLNPMSRNRSADEKPDSAGSTPNQPVSLATTPNATAETSAIQVPVNPLVPFEVRQRMDAFALQHWIQSDSYLLAFLQILPGAGLGSSGHVWKSKCQTITFWIFNLIGLIQSLARVKYQILIDSFDNAKKFYLKLGYYTNGFCYRTIFIYLIWCRRPVREKLQKKIEEFQTITSHDFTSVWIVKLLLGVSTGVCLLIPTTMFDFQFSRMLTIEGTILAYDMHIWSRSSNQTFDSRDLTRGTILSYGIMECVLEFVFTFQEHIIQDICLLGAFTMLTMTWTQRRAIERSRENRDDMSQKLVVWKGYLVLREITKALENTIDVALPFLQFEHIFFTAEFVETAATNFEGFVSTSLSGTMFLKIVLFYVSSVKCFSVNGSMKEWLMDLFPSGEMALEGQEKRSVLLIIHEIDDTPIGIGNSMFFINGKSVAKLVSGVTTISAILSGNHTNA